MILVGFSTGALAFHDFRKGLSLIRGSSSKAIELSALREPELEPLIEAIDSLDLSGFEYVSVHAPSAISAGNEARVVGMLSKISDRGWPIIVHPDVIREASHWRTLGKALTIENNDRRKQSGQRCKDLSGLFHAFPESGFCLDIGHARQVDRTMTEAYFMLKHFSNRLRQLHVSEVNARSKHERLSFLSVQSIKQIAPFIPLGVPAIIESVVPDSYIENEISAAKKALQSVGTNLKKSQRDERVEQSLIENQIF